MKHAYYINKFSIFNPDMHDINFKRMSKSSEYMHLVYMVKHSMYVYFIYYIYNYI